MRALLILLLIFCTPAFSIAENVTLKQEIIPIHIERDTLFFIHQGLGHISSQERADIISKRIEKIIRLKNFKSDSLRVHSDSLHSSIRYQSQVLITINRNDAEAEGYETHNDYAITLSEQLKLSLQKISDRGSIQNILKEIILVIVVICMLIALIYFINKLFRWVRYKIIKGSESKLKSIDFKGYKFVSTRTFTRYLLTLSNVLRAVLVLLVVYLSLPVMFSIFPWTEGIADRLISYLIDPLLRILNSILRYIPNLLTILVIFFFTQFIVKIIAFFSKEIENGALKIEHFYPEWAMPTFKIIRGLLYVFMFIVIFPYLPGAESKVFQGVSVFLGVLISLGSSSAISNVIAGVALTYMRPYKIGDRVKINDMIGDITEKNLLVTRIRSIKNEDITIPNATILSGHTLNYTRASEVQKLILYTKVTINYEVPWKRVHEALLNAAERTPGVVKGKKHFVLQNSFEDFYIHYELNTYVDNSIDFIFIYSYLHENIQDCFKEAGIEIISPHYYALRDGNKREASSGYRKI